jgi:hypothetical protein
MAATQHDSTRRDDDADLELELDVGSSGGVWRKDRAVPAGRCVDVSDSSTFKGFWGEWSDVCFCACDASSGDDGGNKWANG